MRELPLRDELSNERAQLTKAQRDIERGRDRLRRQQEAVASLRAHGRETVEAERLLGLTLGMMVEWERHHQLIQQRILYLERQIVT